MLSYRVKPFVSPFLKKMGRPAYRDLTVLQPKETEIVQVPDILPAGIERITASDPHTTLEQQFANLTETEVHHAPVIRYELGPGLLGPDGYSSWSRTLRLTSDFRKHALTKPIIEFERVDYLNSAVSHRYFGHWLRDGLTTALLAPEHTRYLTLASSWQHVSEYEACFDLRFLPPCLGHARELVVYQDHGQGSSKRARYAELRRRLRAAMEIVSNSRKRRVFLHRGASGQSREIRNAERFLETLHRDGWSILEIAKMSVRAMNESLFDAEIVAGVEGSHMNHAYFTMKKDGALILLTPHDRFTTVHVGTSRASGLRPGIVVMSGNQADGYTVDYDEFRETVDLTLAPRP